MVIQPLKNELIKSKINMLKEFKEFAIKGNVIDLAVAVIIGGAFGKIVSSFVNDVIMPLLGVITGGIDFKDMSLIIREGYINEKGQEFSDVVVSYGVFIQNIIDFLIVAFVIFLAIKSINNLKKKEEAAPALTPQPSKSEVLLEEIRDLLKK
jgi:large conductance mechanosensitive channel